MAAKLIPLMFAAACLSGCGALIAPRQDPVPPVFHSVDEADRALDQAARERVVIENAYADGERVCYTKFFVNSCLDKAKEERRLRLARVRAAEVEAGRYKRAASVEQRDRDLAKAQADFEAEQAARAAAPPRAVPKPAEEEPVPPHPAGPTQEERAAQHEAKLKAEAAKEKAEAPIRAEKAAAFERKKAESEKRQREIAEKKAEKEKEAATKAAADQSK